MNQVVRCHVAVVITARAVTSASSNRILVFIPLACAGVCVATERFNSGAVFFPYACIHPGFCWFLLLTRHCNSEGICKNSDAMIHGSFFWCTADVNLLIALERLLTWKDLTWPVE